MKEEEGARRALYARWQLKPQKRYLGLAVVLPEREIAFLFDPISPQDRSHSSFSCELLTGLDASTLDYLVNGFSGYRWERLA